MSLIVNNVNDAHSQALKGYNETKCRVDLSIASFDRVDLYMASFGAKHSRHAMNVIFRIHHFLEV